MTAAQRQRVRDETRAAILHAARQLFLQGDGFSMRQLAARVECSPAALYLHFKSKDELLRELMRRSFAILFEGAAAVQDRTGEDPVERLRRGMHGYVRTGLAHPDEYRLAFLTTLPEPDGTRPPNAAFERVRERVRRCLDAQRFSPPRPQAGIEANTSLIAQGLWAAVHGVTSLLILRPDFPWVSREALIATVVDGAVDSLVR